MNKKNKIVNKKQRWELLYDTVKKLKKPGDILMHKDIQYIIQVAYIPGGNNSLYSSIVAKANYELTKINLRLKSIHGQGYRVMFPNEYAYDMANQYNRAIHSLEKGKFIADNTPTGSLVQQELNTWTNTCASIVSAQGFMTKITLPKPAKTVTGVTP